MSAASSAQAVTGLLTDPVCPHCHKAITSGALLRSKADELMEALKRAFDATDLPPDVQRDETLDLSAELGVAHWRADGVEFRFIAAHNAARVSAGWKIYMREAAAADPTRLMCGDFDGVASSAQAAYEVAWRVVGRRLTNRLYGTGNALPAQG